MLRIIRLNVSRKGFKGTCLHLHSGALGGNVGESRVSGIRWVGDRNSVDRVEHSLLPNGQVNARDVVVATRRISFPVVSLLGKKGSARRDACVRAFVFC